MSFFSGWILSNPHFPECVASVPVSLWGSGGWGSVCQTLRNRPQPFATARKCPREGRMAVPMASSAKAVAFGGFKSCVASFRLASVALRDIQTCFVTCRKWFCVACAILLQRFQKMRSSFCGRRSTLETSIIISHGRRSASDVSCCGLFANCIVRAASVATRVQIACGRGIFCDVMKIDGSLARNIDFEVADFEVHKKTRRKTSLLKLQSVKTGGGLARNARFEAPTCLVSILWFASAVAVSIWGKLQSTLLFEGIKAGCNVVLHGRRGTSRHFHVFANVSKVVLCDRRNTFARLSAD